MEILELALTGISVLLLALSAIFIRRYLISRLGGTIYMNLRLSTLVPGRGWAPGLARFAGDELRWYRLFSLGLRPRRVLLRDNLVIEERRVPCGPETLAMPTGWIILRCRGVGTGPVSPIGVGRDPVPRAALTAAASAASAGPDGASAHKHGSGPRAAPVEVALTETAYAGFLSWLESAPPGTRRR